MEEAEHDIVSGPNGPDSYDTVGGRICRAREACALSPAQLARRLGIKTATLHSWENDKSEPRSNKLVMLSGVLNVSPSWLIMGEGQAPITPDESDKAKLEDMRYELIQLHKQAKEISEKIESLIGRL
ncbi:MAG: helix-turn-helix domain-containing protein [Pseudomonadota bacterium]